MQDDHARRLSSRMSARLLLLYIPQAGLTVSSLARETGITRRAIESWFSSTKVWNMPLSNFSAIVTALNLSEARRGYLEGAWIAEMLLTEWLNQPDPEVLRAVFERQIPVPARTWLWKTFHPEENPLEDDPTRVGDQRVELRLDEDEYDAIRANLLRLAESVSESPASHRVTQQAYACLAHSALLATSEEVKVRTGKILERAYEACDPTAYTDRRDLAIRLSALGRPEVLYDYMKGTAHSEPDAEANIRHLQRICQDGGDGVRALKTLIEISQTAHERPTLPLNLRTITQLIARHRDTIFNDVAAVMKLQTLVGGCVDAREPDAPTRLAVPYAEQIRGEIGTWLASLSGKNPSGTQVDAAGDLSRLLLKLDKLVDRLGPTTG